MQSITIDVSEDYIKKFLNVLEALPKNKVKLKEDLSKELEARITEVQTDDSASLPFDEGLESMKKRLRAKYAN